MIWLALALIIVSLVCGLVAFKYIELLKVESDRRYEVNTKSAEAEISAAIEEALKKFDDRINNTWSTISSVKEELNALRLQIGLRKH
jgi:ABC-type transporter Mla subunit MlaD